MKVDILDHFPIVFALCKIERSKPEDEDQFTCKFIYGEEQTELLQHELSQIDWKGIIKTLGPNTLYKISLI